MLMWLDRNVKFIFWNHCQICFVHTVFRDQDQQIKYLFLYYVVWVNPVQSNTYYVMLRKNIYHGTMNLIINQ